jgi:RNA polymerase sigma-70 factor (ECF subfamily)
VRRPAEGARIAVTEPTDDELMVRGAAGNDDAFRILVRRWERPVFAFLDRMLGSREEAQDVAQETFLRVCRNAGRYEGNGRFKSWLFRIAGNLARTRLRRRKIVRWIPFDLARHDLAGEDAADRGLEAGESGAAVRRALSALPERQREAVLLRHFEEMSHRDIADALETTVSAVESLLHRAMATLRQELSEGETP